MNDTIDLTTPQGLYAEQRRLAAAWGEHVSIGVCKDGAQIYLSRHYQQNLQDARFFKAPTFSEAIKIASDHVDAWKTTRRETTVRKLALAIIETTDEHTHCTVTLLRAKGFSESDIHEFHEAACARASEMCGRAPFVVEGV